MGAPQLSEPIRTRLVSLLAEDRPDARRLMDRLRELRDEEGVPAFAASLHLLAHVDLPDAQAERLLEDLLRHRAEVTRALERDPGLRVTAIDFLSNVKRLLVNPTIVERSHLERTERSAITDGLTGLYNRRFFVTSLGLEVQRSRRYGLRLSLLMLDLDAFKRLNDEHGHLFGDQVLQRVGRILRRAVREADLACRYGGEEFTVILPETDRLGAYAVAERIRVRIHRGFRERGIAGKNVRVAVSGGIATYPDDAEDTEGLVARADQALYLSKNLGRNRISLYHSERRGSIRFPARPGARAQIRFVAGGERREACMVNLSRSGALLDVDGDGHPADAVELDFTGGAGHGRSWSRHGRIVRIDRRSSPVPRSRLAIEFDEPLPDECLTQQVLRSEARRVVQGGRG